MVLVTYKPMNSIVLVGLIIIAIHFLQSGRKHVTLPGAEESMTTTIEFITALFSQVDDQLAGPPRAQRDRHLGAVAPAQRRRQPPLLSVADSRLSGLVSAAPRAHPALS